MTLTNEQIDTILSGYERAQQNGDFTTWLSIYRDDFISALEMAKENVWTKQDSINVIQDRINCYTNKLHNEGGCRQTKVEQRFAIEVLEITKREIEIEKKQEPRELRNPPKESE